MRAIVRRHAVDGPIFFDLLGVDVFDVGEWNGKKYSDADLDEMVSNFRELQPLGYDFPVKLGHGAQEILDREDLPAAGYISRLYRSGTKLVADFTRVPEKIKDVVELGAYRTVSAEIYDKVQLLGKTFKNVISAIAFLGGDIPAVGTLDDIVALYHRPDSRVLMFSELSGAKRALVTYAKKEGSVATKNKTVDDTETLHEELVALADRASTATSGKKGAPSFRTLLRESIAKLKAMLKTPEKNAVDSYQERWMELTEAVREKYGGPDGYTAWLEDFGVDDSGDFLVMNWNGDFWKVPYTDNEEAEVITLGDPVEVEQGPWVPVNTPSTNAPIKKRIKTTPATTSGGKEDDMAVLSPAVLKALGLPEDADEQSVLKAIADRDAEKAKFAAANGELVDLRGEITKMKAEKTVDEAIRAHKVLPAQREWAMGYAASDPKGFSTFIEKTPTVVDTSESGSSGDAPEAKSPVAEFRAKVAEKVKAGMQIDDAQKQVAAEEPELFAATRARQ